MRLLLLLSGMHLRESGFYMEKNEASPEDLCAFVLPLERLLLSGFIMLFADMRVFI